MNLVPLFTTQLTVPFSCLVSSRMMRNPSDSDLWFSNEPSNPFPLSATVMVNIPSVVDSQDMVMVPCWLSSNAYFNALVITSFSMRPNGTDLSISNSKCYICHLKFQK